MAISRNSEFASLFKKYRLRSEIETLTELGDLLAEEGVVYENSLYTRWQKGQRTPRERNLLLKLLYIFAKRGGVKTLEEANTILAAANQRDLNSDETTALQEHFKQIRVRSVPEKGDIFVGRHQMMKDIGWLLINKKKVLIHGVPGVGKTALAVQIGHLLKNSFADGVFWFRADLKQFEAILDELLTGLGYDVSGVTNIELKKEKLRQLVKNRSVLIILDNVDHIQSLSPIFQELLSLPVAILYTSISNITEKRIETVKIGYFSKEEYFSLAATILGGPFVEVNHEKLEKIATLLGYLPISCVIILKQICSNPKQLDEYLEKLEKRTLNLRDVEYDNKNLYSALELSIRRLDTKLQEVLKATAVFDGADFGVEGLAFIVGTSKSKAQTYLSKLNEFSFIQKSTKGRYRLHPLIKQYLTEKNGSYAFFAKLIEYYKIYFTKKTIGDEVPYTQIDREIENIIALINKCYYAAKYREVIALWECVNTFLWVSGKWDSILNLAERIERSYEKISDIYGQLNFITEDLNRIQFFRGNLTKCVEYMNESEKLAANSQDANLLGLHKQKWGIVNLGLRKLRESTQDLLLSIELLDKKTHYRDLYKSYGYLGKVFTYMKKYKKAHKCFDYALKQSRKRKVIDVMAMSLNYSGGMYIALKKYDRAIECLTESLQLEKKLKRKYAIGSLYEEFANAYKGKNEIAKATMYSEMAEKMYLELQIVRNKELPVQSKKSIPKKKK